MKKIIITKVSIFIGLLMVFNLISCGKTDFLKHAGDPLMIEILTLNKGTIGGGDGGPTGGGGGNTTTGQPIDPNSKDGLHAIFNGSLGIPIARASLGAIGNDATGLNANNDYDGDGIPNDLEEAGFTNPYVSEYPRITTRVSVPITMELMVSETDETQNHTEMVSDQDTKNTIDNSMETKNYNQLNQKTTPYVVKSSDSASMKMAGSEGYSMSASTSVSAAIVEVSASMSMSKNKSWDNEMSKSTMSEKTVFDDINYVDNLNRNGVEFKNDTVERISRNYRLSNVSKSNFVINPNAGLVRAGLYIKNETLNQPVRISNVICTLSFRTPSGKCLPVQTFRLRNDDYSEFDQEIYGGDELGPYAIEIKGLNTYEVKQAMANGYVPQIHVVNYDMHRVEDSNYNPGVDNLKIVEETAKGRTALIKIICNGVRDIYRVPAFDVNDDGLVSPGISLKKALFHIYRNRLGGGESWNHDNQWDSYHDLDGDNLWDHDSEGFEPTVPDTGLHWKAGFVPSTDDPKGQEYRYSNNTTGNSWSQFSTYVKRYIVYERDSTGKVVEREKRIETIDRIGNIKKYNPFSSEDNASYNPNEPLTRDELMKMKYWVVLHNGRYYNGDINDPIWGGERYEIVLFDAKDFNEQLNDFCYTPLQNASGQDTTPTQYSAIQSYADFYMNTLWNKNYNTGNLARAKYLGKIVRGDTVKLEVELDEFRSLFNVSQPGKEFDPSISVQNTPGRIWHKFNYTFDTGDTIPDGKPDNFSFEAWGGCNQIGLWIQESRNARYYAAALWKQGEEEADARIVRIDSAALKENSGFVTINRFSKDEQGNDLGVLDPGSYRVKIRAWGTAYNVPVSTLNSANATGIMVTDVTNPAGTELPAFFNASVYSSLNTITVNINQADNAEYYSIDIQGPYNYGFGNGKPEYPEPPKITKIGHPGVNIITIPDLNASSMGYAELLTNEEKNFQVPGVYRVEIHATNRNIVNADGSLITDKKPTPANGDPPTVMVDYNPYGNQRVYAPQRQIEQFNPKDVDLEVNFNEGSGWFRLKLSHDDIGDEDRTINCQYTTSFNESKGRVTIYFTAPTGSDSPQNNVYNVFRGGAEDVEVYLRTVAKPEYRDCMWLKKNDSEVFNPNEYPDRTVWPRCIGINDLINNLPGYDPIKYWIMNENTDVANFENFTLNDTRVSTSLSGLSGIPSGDFGVIAQNGKSDFFFSPMKKFTYKVSASLVGDVDIAYLMGETNHVDNPEYRPLGGNNSIKLSNIDLQYGNSYRAYIKKGRPASSSEDLTTTNHWYSPYGDILTSENQHEYIFDKYLPAEGGEAASLLSNVEYTICMVAKNATVNNNVTNTTTSSRVCSYIKTIAGAEQQQLINAVDNNGAGFFMNPAVPLTKTYGDILLPGVDFAYGQQLLGGTYDIYDTGTNELLSTNPARYFRIVHNGVNVAKPLSLGGLNLMPVAMDLSTGIVTPPANQVYIDPASAMYVLPRPVYWSKFETVANINNAEIFNETPSTSEISYYVSGYRYSSSDIESGRFGNGLRCLAYVDGRSGISPSDIWSQRVIYPRGTGSIDIRKGTISCWVFVGRSIYQGFDSDEQAQSYIDIIAPNALMFVRIMTWQTTGRFGSVDTTSASLYLNGNGPYGNVVSITPDQWHHIYAVWDANAGLAGGKTVRVWIDGASSPQIETSTALPDLLSKTMSIFMSAYAYELDGMWGWGTSLSSCKIDNVKIWNYALPEDPSWEYNGGAGRVDALHPIYGEATGYRPKLTAPGGVGFYCVPR